MRDRSTQQPAPAPHGADSAVALRDAALLAGLTLERVLAATGGKVAPAIGRAPRPVLAVAGLAAAAGVAALVHLTGIGAGPGIGAGIAWIWSTPPAVGAPRLDR
jgi:hypothetical protein